MLGVERHIVLMAGLMFRETAVCLPYAMAGLAYALAALMTSKSTIVCSFIDPVSRMDRLRDRAFVIQRQSLSSTETSCAPEYISAH